MPLLMMAPSQRIQDYAAHKSAKLGPRAVAMLHDAAEAERVDNWEVMVCVAWYESGFNPEARSKPSGNYNGLLQIGRRQHAKNMRLAGLDYAKEADRLRWGMRMYERGGLAPWSVRARAKRDYDRLK